MLKLARVLAFAGLAGVGLPGRAAGQADGGAVARAANARPLPGDRIFLHILREPLLSDTVTVSERGEAAFPKLGVLPVTSWSIAQLNDTLRARYTEYLRTPELEVVVLRKVVVNGEVMKPDVYLVDVSATLSDAIARAGGFTPSANRNDIRVIREGTTRRVSGWERGSTADLDLRSGDEIVVGRRAWLVLNVLPAISTVALITSILIALR